MSKKQRQQQLRVAQEAFDKACDAWYAYEYDDALESFTQSLVVREAFLGKYHAHTSRTYYSMGCALHGKGDYEEALIALRRALRIAKVMGDGARVQAAKDYILWVFGKNGKRPKDATAYQANIEKATEWEQKGDKQKGHEALESYNKALELESSVAGTGHVDIADLFVKIAREQQALGGDSKNQAIENYQKALEIYKDAFGEDHVYTKTTQTHMNGNMGETTNHTESSEHGTEAPPKAQRIFSPQELLLFDKNASHVDKSLKFFYPNRSEFRKVRGGIRYDTAARYLFIGRGFQRNNQLEDALLALRRAWRIRDSVYGRAHPLTTQAMDYLEDCLTAINSSSANRQFSAYRQSLEDAVDIERSGKKFEADNKIEPALREFQRCAQLEEKFVGQHHLEYADLKLKCGDLYAKKKEFDKGLSAYRTAVLIYQSAYGRGHPWTHQAFQKFHSIREGGNVGLSLSVSAHPIPGSDAKSGNSVTGLGLSKHRNRHSVLL